MICSFFTGCASLDKAQVKLGLKNDDFNYIRDGKIRKVIIQNNRDKGFRYEITDKKAINELYDILSSAKVVGDKSKLKPDYIFEFQESDKKVYKFNYIVGLDKKYAGNFYSDNKSYFVSGRLGTDIIDSFSVSRTPKDFKNIYYEAILEVIEEYKKDIKKNVSVGVNIDDDVEISRFILSTELEDFKSELKDKNASLIENNKKYDVTASVQTSGYRTSTKETNYKCIITLDNSENNTEKKYYVKGIYNSNNRWDIKLSPDKMPN